MHRNGAGLPGLFLNLTAKDKGRALSYLCAPKSRTGHGCAWKKGKKSALPARQRKQQNTAADKPPQGAFFFARSTVCADESKISPRLFYNLCTPI